MATHISFVLATHNRPGCVRRTIDQLQRCGLDRSAFQIIVIDNASTDPVDSDVMDKCDHFLRLEDNFGSCAKARGIKLTDSPFVVFLDDDSFPRPGSIARMIRHFECSPKLGAAGFTVHLPNGDQEGAALPNVFVGCGVGLRRAALEACGGLDESFFMQAEEYDLAFRLTMAGWEVRTFDDLHVEHDKTKQSRKSERTTYFDIRNNIRVAARYLPTPAYRVYLDDWMQRYEWLAQRTDHISAFECGKEDGMRMGLVERKAHRANRLAANHFEQCFQWQTIDHEMKSLADRGDQKVILADMGKNIYPYHRAARHYNLNILAIGDDGFASDQRFYRGTPILSLEEALDLNPDAIVVANGSAVHGTRTLDRVRSKCKVPAYFWNARQNPTHNCTSTTTPEFAPVV